MTTGISSQVNPVQACCAVRGERYRTRRAYEPTSVTPSPLFMNRGLVVAAVVFATGCLASVRREPVERIVFASTRRGNTDIYLANADGTGLRRLTTDTAADRQPRCSRDRRHVVFVRGDGPGRAIYRIDLADGSEHRLTPAGVYDYTPTWAPGGDRIYFTRGGSGGVSDRLRRCGRMARS